MRSVLSGIVYTRCNQKSFREPNKGVRCVTLQQSSDNQPPHFQTQFFHSRIIVFNWTYCISGTFDGQSQPGLGPQIIQSIENNSLVPPFTTYVTQTRLLTLSEAHLIWEMKKITPIIREDNKV